jgi:putative ABC transport system permease protein
VLKNYIKIALRNLWKHKTFTVVNVTGMAVAFAAAILLMLSAFHELSFDKFHSNKDRIYQVYFEEHRVNEVSRNTNMPVPMGPALLSEIPEVQQAVRFIGFGGGSVRYNNKDFSLNIKCSDPAVLSTFTFPLVKGSAVTALAGLDDIVLTESSAKVIFGEQDPVGKTIELHAPGSTRNFMVSAVAKDVPANSSLYFGGLIRFENAPGYAENINRWDNQNHDAFIQLKEGASVTAFEQKVKPFLHKYEKENIDLLKRDGATPDAEGEYLRLRTIPLQDVHFSKFSNLGGTSRLFPYLILVISGFILLIACVNFINLSLARAFTRSKEIGLRKVLGAGNRHIFSQFWGEATFICCISFLVGLLLAYIILPSYKSIFNQPLSLLQLLHPSTLLYLICGILLISFLAGGYPAKVLSSFAVSQTVKGKIGTGRTGRVRNGLMVIQFALSCLLIICTLVISRQVNFLRSQSTGYDKSSVISIPVGNKVQGSQALALLRQKLSALPEVEAVSATDMNLGMGRDGSSSTSIMGFDFKGKNIKTNWLRIDYDYLKTLGLQLKEGRDLSKEYGMDSLSVLVNETMAAQLGKNAVGAVLELDNARLTVAGVVKDFNYKSLHQQIKPLTMFMRSGWDIRYIFVKVRGASLATAMQKVTAVWKDIDPKSAEAISFLDENTERQYRKETYMSRIFMSGAVIAIILSCMGLFAIAILVINQRTKEIGIRKVMGASVTSIVNMLSADFLKLVLLGIVIASPLAWYLLHSWLQGFAYRISIGWWVFAAAGIIAVLIALLTISFHAVKAAVANPVKSLRNE